MAHIYNGILFSHKKWQNCVIFRYVVDLETANTMKSEKKKKMYTNTYMWNLENWYIWSCLQSRNRDRDIKNKHMDTKWKGKWDKLRGWDWHIHTIGTIYHRNSLLCGDLSGKEIKKEGYM